MRHRVTPQTKQRKGSTPSTCHRRVAGKALQRQLKKKQQLQGNRAKSHTKKPIKANVPPHRFLHLAAQKAKREQWTAIAEETQRIVLGDCKYVEERRIPVASSSATQQAQGLLSGPLAFEASKGFSIMCHVTHNIFAQVQLSRQGTVFRPHYCEALAKWATVPPQITAPTPPGTAIEFTRSSTLTAARRLVPPTSQQSSGPILSVNSIGILSFASPKRPGGGFLHGGDEQEETIARHSSLVASLSSPAAHGFYKEHRKYWVEDGSGLHDHSMLYSPGVVVFRADADDDCNSPPEDAVGGVFIAPYTVNIVSAVPVNAAAVRAKHIILPEEHEFFEQGIRSAMKERMARVLRLFEERGDRTLVLGAFGTGSNENKAEVIGAIWAELLVCDEQVGKQPARFKDVFDKIVFAVPGKHFESFKQGFEMRVLTAELEAATSS